MFTLPFLVVVGPTLNPEPVRRAVVAALQLAGMNQKIAADKAGCSMAQFSRQLTSGSLPLARVLAIGPEFVAALLPLLADAAGVEPRHYEARRVS